MPPPHPDLDALWRIESPRLIARLARIVRDVGLAEELAQDTFLAAMQRWPAEGTPANPAAWLMAAAKNKAVDHVRRDRLHRDKHQDLARDRRATTDPTPDLDAQLDDEIGDDLLRLMFTACHPVLSREARAALTLRLVAGLTTDQIARAFLVPEPTIAQRIVRAKKTLTEKRVPVEVPRGPDLADRLASVLDVLYLLFNEGYTATAGDDWLRKDLCDEALRLGRVLAELAPAQPEVHGLVALMELQASRAHARTTPDGRPILLPDQDRARWDQLLIRRGLAALDRATALAHPPGPYVLQAQIAACHARARAYAETDWRRIASLYADLSHLTHSPVVELNRAVALSMSDGPAAALPIVDALADDPRLAHYHLLPATRADLLSKLNRLPEAHAEFLRAASLTQNHHERTLLLHRAAECAPRPPTP